MSKKSTQKTIEKKNRNNIVRNQKCRYFGMKLASISTHVYIHAKKIAIKNTNG